MRYLILPAWNERYATAQTDIALAQHGENVYYLLDEEDGARSLDLARMIAMMKDRLSSQEYDPEVDAIVLTGSMLQVAALLAAALTGWGRAEVLIFDAPNEQYIRTSLCMTP